MDFATEKSSAVKQSKGERSASCQVTIQCCKDRVLQGVRYSSRNARPGSNSMHAHHVLHTRHSTFPIYSTNSSLRLTHGTDYAHQLLHSFHSSKLTSPAASPAGSMSSVHHSLLFSSIKGLTRLDLEQMLVLPVGAVTHGYVMRWLGEVQADLWLPT